MFIFYILSFLLFSSNTNSQRCTSDQDCPTNYYCSVLDGCISSGNTLESACAVNPCQQNCRCVQSRIHGSGFYCDSPGFLGKTCTIPKPTLDCGANRILVTISDKILKEYGMVPANSYVRMGTIPPFRSTSLDFDQCSINTSSNGLFTYTIPLPFQSCGTSTFTKTSTNELTQVFTNEVWLNTKGMLFDVPVPIFRWTCAYSLDYSLVTSLIPAWILYRL
uniref:ZP domain-containing protein n=1 Tax=Ciona savignyi TaxID=51511 RepID=H2ZNM9_CIOSA